MFDRIKFSVLIKKIRGNRTTDQLAKESGVNAAFLSNLINGRIESPPALDTIDLLIATIANKPYYEEFYGQILEAAGYLDGEYVKRKIIELTSKSEFLTKSIKHRKLESQVTNSRLDQILKGTGRGDEEFDLINHLEKIKLELNELEMQLFSINSELALYHNVQTRVLQGIQDKPEAVIPIHSDELLNDPQLLEIIAIVRSLSSEKRTVLQRFAEALLEEEKSPASIANQ